jgi:hypothetical protein
MILIILLGGNLANAGHNILSSSQLAYASGINSAFEEVGKLIMQKVS